MVLNPFEGKEYDLLNILYRDELGYFDIKHPYDKIFPELDYDTLLKSINTKIDWINAEFYEHNIRKDNLI